MLNLRDIEGMAVSRWIRKNKAGLLVNIAAAAVWSPVPVVFGLLWKSIVPATIPHTGLLWLLRSDIRASVWMLPALFLLSMVLLHLTRYIRLYRYRADTFFGLDFIWRYSFPRGRVVRVRAFCPHCRKPASEPVGFLDRYDNFLCRNCDYNTESRHAERMEYPWRAAVQRRVNAQFYTPPEA